MTIKLTIPDELNPDQLGFDLIVENIRERLADSYIDLQPENFEQLADDPTDMTAPTEPPGEIDGDGPTQDGPDPISRD